MYRTYGASTRLFIDIRYWVGNVADTTLAPLFSPVYPGPILGQVYLGAEINFIFIQPCCEMKFRLSDRQ